MSAPSPRQILIPGLPGDVPGASDPSYLPELPMPDFIPLPVDPVLGAIAQNRLGKDGGRVKIPGTNTQIGPKTPEQVVTPLLPEPIRSIADPIGIGGDLHPPKNPTSYIPGLPKDIGAILDPAGESLQNMDPFPLKDVVDKGNPSPIQAGPEPLPPPPTPDAPDVQQATEEAMKEERLRAAKGRLSTLLTGGRGLLYGPNSLRRTLLGG